MNSFGNPFTMQSTSFGSVEGVENDFSVQRAKRQQVKNACTNCQKACKKCDDGRPCQRCIKYGLTDTCVNSQRKERKKGSRRNSTRSPNRSNSSEGKHRKTKIRRKSNIVSDSEGEEDSDFFLEEDDIGSNRRGSTRVLAKNLHLKDLESEVMKTNFMLKIKKKEAPLTPPVSRSITPIMNVNRSKSLSVLSQLCAAEIDGVDSVSSTDFVDSEETDDDKDVMNIVRQLFSPPETPPQKLADIENSALELKNAVIPVEYKDKEQEKGQNSFLSINYLVENHPGDSSKTPMQSPVYLAAPTALSNTALFSFFSSVKQDDNPSDV